MTDFASLIKALIGEALLRANVIGRRQVIVVSTSGTGSARRITYKMDAGDPNRYTSAALDSYVNPVAGESVWLDTMAGDTLIIGRVG